MNDDTPGVPGVPESGEQGADLAAVRNLVLRAHPDTIPELIVGESVSALLASVDPAREAYRRALDSTQAAAGDQTRAAAFVPAVPAGAAPALVVDPDRLPPTEKIRRGLAARG
jgi:hypothetical protein